MTSAVLKDMAQKEGSTGVSGEMDQQQVLNVVIDFIPNSEFESRSDEPEALVEETLNGTAGSSKAPADLPGHLRRLCESVLLSQEQETALFREMNFLKYRAHQLRNELDASAPDPAAINEVADLLARAQRVRDHIVKANMRLVMSVVKKFVTPQQSFDDMLSDGAFTLMQAVEKFDYDRGFRFSTYAYRSIARNAYRSLTAARKEESRFTRDAEDWAFEQPAGAAASATTDQVWTNLRNTTSDMLERLDRRERFIIRSRYALGSHRKVKTFQYLADKLGVSKERVRQLEQRAVSKLQAMAAELERDDLFTAAMA